jgi:hypothetical protein
MMAKILVDLKRETKVELGEESNYLLNFNNDNVKNLTRL